jgi:hypothetical protein
MKALVYEENLLGVRGVVVRALAALGRAIGVWSDTYPAVSWFDALAWLSTHAREPWTGVTFWLPDDGIFEVLVLAVDVRRNSEIGRLVEGVLRVCSARCVFRLGCWPFCMTARVPWRVPAEAPVEQRRWVQ